MEERIDIVTVDRVDATSAQKIRAIADAADAAQKHLDALNRALGGLGSGALGPMAAQLAQLATLAPKAAQAQVQLAQANDRAAISWAKQEEALSRAVIAEQRMEQAISRTSVAQSAQSIAAAKANTAYLEQERALFRALEAEQNYIAATARAELAQVKLTTATDKRATAQRDATRAAEAEIVKLNEYSQAVVRATNVTSQFETAKQTAYNPYAGGMGANVTAGFGSTAGALFGYQNPFGPGRAGAPASSGFAASAGGAYSIAVQSAKELALATEQLSGQAEKAAIGIGKADRATAGFAQRGRLAHHEMANLGYQLQDIVVSLAGGQNPFMVLLQQGAQIQAIYSMRGEGVGKVFGDVAGILVRMVNPATLIGTAVAGTALAIGLFADKAGDIQRMSQLLGTTAEQTQILQKTLDQMSRGNMGFGEFTKEAKDFALALDDATRNPKSQLARLFEVNNKSLTDTTGKLKSQNDLWKMSVDLIRGAANEVQAIQVGRLLGLQEDFTREIYKSKQGFTEVQKEVENTGTILDSATVKKAAEFEKGWGDAWRAFTRGASNAITQVEASMFTFLERLAKDNSFGKWIEGFIPGSIENANNFNAALMGGIPKGFTYNQNSGVAEPPFPMRSTGGPFPGLMDGLENLLKGGLINGSQSGQMVQGGGLGGLMSGRLNIMDIKTTADIAADNALAELARTLTGKGGPIAGLSGGGGSIASRPDASSNGAVPTSSTGGPARAGTTVLPPNAPPKEDKTEEKRADALARVNRELESQLKLMGMLGPERQVEQQMSEIENSLAIKKIQLTKGEKEAIQDQLQTLQQMQPVQAAMNKLYEDAAGPLRDYNALVEAGSKLLADGKISAQQYQDATRGAWEKVLEQQNTVGAGIELGFMQTYDSLKLGSQGTADYVKQALGGVEDAFVQLASTGKITFESLTTSILADVARMIFRLYILKPLLESLGLGTSTPTATPSPGLGAPGTGGSMAAAYDNGADFTVGGSTGKDRNLVMFRATRGERVSVTPADHNHIARAQRSVGGQLAAAPVQVQVINNSSARVSKVQETRGQDGRRLVRMIVEEAKAAVAADIQAGGTDISKSIENRFGINSAAGIQL